MEKTNKLNSKDLINIGIYTAMYLVVFFVVGMMNAVPILYPISLFFVPIVTGIPFMLFATKVKKSGMVFTWSVLVCSRIYLDTTCFLYCCWYFSRNFL